MAQEIQASLSSTTGERARTEWVGNRSEQLPRSLPLLSGRKKNKSFLFDFFFVPPLSLEGTHRQQAE